MKKLLTLGLFVVALIAPNLSHASAPALVPVQGYLTDGNGDPLDGDVDLAFAFYSDEVGGSALFTESQAVTVDQGYFTAYVGDIELLDLALFRDNAPLFLGVTVGTDSEMTPRFELGSAPFAGYAEYAGSAADAELLEGHPASDFRLASDTPSWTELTDRPADLTDGDSDLLAGLSCASGQLAKWSGSAWSCGDDLDSGGDVTAVTAGTGLTGGGTSGDVALNVDPTAVQTRIATNCAAGNSIRQINQDGTVVCEPDDDTNTTYSAGTGLSMSGTTLSVDPTAVQTRVGATCAAGSSIRQILENGGVYCEQDDTSPWSSATGGINYASGNVGIGVTNPGAKLDVNGVVKSKKYAFSVDRLNQSQQFNADGILDFRSTQTGVTKVDPDGAFNSTTGQFVAPVDGIYFFGFTFTIVPTTIVDDNFILFFRKNENLGYINALIQNQNLKPYTPISLTRMVQMSAGDTMDIYIQSVTEPFGALYPEFHGFLVAPL